ncbi:MAG: ATP-binding protein [Deltaproteobacteria bacterium]|nr:ATP-binding protein [Deltaproteobacteria bacterium]
MQDKNKFEISKSEKQLSISFSSSMDNIDRIDKETRKLLEKELSDSQIFAVSLSMREGLTNAIKHGHRSDSDKIIQYTLTSKEDKLIIEIEDQGEGFDWRKNRKKKPNPELDHGRGLTIINEYCSEYSYNEKGNKLKMTIHKSATK